MRHVMYAADSLATEGEYANRFAGVGRLFGDGSLDRLHRYVGVAGAEREPVLLGVQIHAGGLAVNKTLCTLNLHTWAG